MFGAISAAMFAAATAAAAGSGVQTFQVAPVEMSVQPPAGFCPPQEGKAAAAIKLAAAADPENVTALALLQCDDTDATRADYLLIKTPKDALDLTIDRPTLLALLRKSMDLPQFNTAEGIVDNSKIEKNFADATGGEKPDLGGAIKPLGVDKDCAYMGGVLTFKSTAISYTRAVSACMTSVGKMIAVTRYSDGTVPGNMMWHLASARALAMAIKAKP